MRVPPQESLHLRPLPRKWRVNATSVSGRIAQLLRDGVGQRPPPLRRTLRGPVMKRAQRQVAN
jgi:hypothetical protein